MEELIQELAFASHEFELKWECGTGFELHAEMFPSLPKRVGKVWLIHSTEEGAMEEAFEEAIKWCGQQA